MAITTLQLKIMARRWRDILKNSTRIRDFCVEKYGRRPTIFVGVNGRKLPDKRHGPAIFILPGVKTEGLIPEFAHAIAVSWFIVQEKISVDGVEQPWRENVTGELIEFLGAYEADDLGQIIYEVLAEELMDDYPITKAEYDIDTSPEYFPQWPGHMVLTTEIDPCMGEIIYYEE